MQRMLTDDEWWKGLRRGVHRSGRAFHLGCTAEATMEVIGRSSAKKGRLDSIGESGLSRDDCDFSATCTSKTL